MKRLLVLRHAKAEAESASGKDFDRPLAERGWQDATAVGRAMRERGLCPDAIVASPARRVVETLAALAEGYGKLDPDYDRRIYNASPETLLDVVREADDAVQTILLVGHNPGLPLLLLQLAHTDNHDLLARIEQGFPTATLAVVELADRWADAGSPRGKVVDLILR
jgi:phosphohistidine phosphatase